MGIAEKLSEWVSDDDRNLGLRLVNRGSVTIEDSEADWVGAIVNDRDSYDVSLRREKGAVRFGCDCDDYYDRLQPAPTSGPRCWPPIKKGLRNSGKPAGS